MKNVRRTLNGRLKDDLRDPIFKKAFDAEDMPARLAISVVGMFALPRSR